NGKASAPLIRAPGGLSVGSPSLAQKVGMGIEGKLDARGSGSGTMQAGLTKVSRLDLGGATIKDQIFMSAPLDSMANVEGMEMPGMVGFETFRRFVTRVDYGNHTITLI